MILGKNRSGYPAPFKPGKHEHLFLPRAQAAAKKAARTRPPQSAEERARLTALALSASVVRSPPGGSKD